MENSTIDNNVPADNTAETNEQPVQTPVIDQEKLRQYNEQLRMEQNLPLGAAAGIAAAFVGALAWAVITVLTGYQIGYMAVAVGFLVGYAVRHFGKGMDQIFGIIGAAMALLGCLLGNLLSSVAFIADAESLNYFTVISMLNVEIIGNIFTETFSPIDLLFYGIALYEGYKFSFRQLTEEELLANAV